MQTREEIITKLKQLKPSLMAEFPLHAIALFGSYARNEQSESSDVDVLVDVAPSIGLGFVDLADMIEDALGIKTDVIPADGLKPRYKPFVERDLIYV
jgi:predicted nucleotidyltransferase